MKFSGRCAMWLAVVVVVVVVACGGATATAGAGAGGGEAGSGDGGVSVCGAQGGGGGGSGNCTTCANGAQCCGGEQCCNGGKSCAPADSVCCGDVTCSKTTQTCCADPKHGDICCERETSSCCPPQDPLPSRCCPRWYVCCGSGKYGCCNPVTGEPLLSLNSFDFSTGDASAPAAAPAEDSSTAVALMVIPDLKDDAPLYGVTIDTAHATHAKHGPVAFNNYGESTRTFAFVPSSGLFVLPQANFTGPGPDTDRKISLTRVDPTTGKAVTMPVALAASAVGDLAAAPEPLGLVTGFAWLPAKDVLVMSTYVYDSAGAPAGYNFYEVDVASGAAVFVATTSDSTAWSGWYDTAAVVDGATVLYRIGYEDVLASANPGLGLTTLSSSGAVSTVFVSVAPPQGYAPLLSLDLVSADGGAFVSIAPEASITHSGLALFSWSVNVTAASLTKVPTKVAELGNAHTEPYFGPLATAVDSPNTDKATSFVALVVHDALDHNFDRVALITADLSTGKAENRELEPLALAELDSFSGLGIPL